ncbi:50S ribosomal protein L21 [Candidatus Phytoplasma australiense]|uniref:Large ribosomal subunit protein bL21 n=2 Tax=Phytoplasma australiense TaxID=59748 RepID=RL21_PHYAS|nr:50S ribosomal protein L21 [Candidatus Phytoplasma australiense]B1VAF5.1 RecName: Full=Large ribosomal subunit protein bL21; AltName: Full=50S ribosomal protein L21 [Candidatus Phytoplasma australiense]AGL90315.1 50S ribosomal protein L21 [Strawberry lethal yellows phytoplasma (CPA) str. NZSb11]CAM11928.1 50S ribosomal protein L21 [Candidatus Phytoplasma australiense]
MFAIIRTGGKQLRVSEGQEIFVEKLPINPEQNYEFKEVLAVYGEKSILGQPYVEGAKVQAQVIKNDRAKKIIVFKYKRRKKYRCKQGHRQAYTKLLITKIIA